MGKKKAHPHPLCIYTLAVGKQAMTHYTRKGYAYQGVSLIPQGCVKISFADYLSVSPIEILNTLISVPRCPCSAALVFD